MGIRVALNHKTSYRYDRAVNLGPQVVRLRPAPHSRTTILSYSLKVQPEKHFINWQQDAHGNHLARLVFVEPTRVFELEVDLIADLTVINPFDFFLEERAEDYPFAYSEEERPSLEIYREKAKQGPRFDKLLAKVDRKKQRSVDFLVQVNQLVQSSLEYVLRPEVGLQEPEETLELGSGSCRDYAWLEVQLFRHLGLAARFVSGYSIQLVADVKPLEGAVGVSQDVTDLHAWTEVYLPGAGWIGLDGTSGLMAGEGHIPLACTASPELAAPISGSLEDCETEFHFSTEVFRLREERRSTRPYSEAEWEAILDAGQKVEERLVADDVRLTVGGEPTFVSIDDFVGEEWNTAASGEEKRRLAEELIGRLRRRFATGGLLQYGQGKWYPGESLPRWSLHCLWRTDGEPIWNDERWLAPAAGKLAHDATDAERLTRGLATQLGVEPDHVLPAYEDAFYYAWKERKLPVNVDPLESKLDDPEERTRLLEVFRHGLGNPIGFVLPVERREKKKGMVWVSSLWMLRGRHLLVNPGDSPIGLRLPLNSVPWADPKDIPASGAPDPFAPRAALAPREQLGTHRAPDVVPVPTRHQRALDPEASTDSAPLPGPDAPDRGQVSAKDIVRSALAVEPRDGRLHVFLPPVERLEDYLDLVAAVEEVAVELKTPVVIEGYLPPEDHRIRVLKVTPDPGVIEVNVQPAASWQELCDVVLSVYEEARLTRLGTEKYLVDGRRVGTGGGNHIVLGGATPPDSPFLRRPDLLRSMIGYWINHPSLSYLFSSLFLGPTSQSPRVDEARHDLIYELEIAFSQIPEEGPCAPWLVDRVFRHLLVDVTGNTHRTEFCIDKLYSPDSASGRLGLLELRSFEMPPHARMSVAQHLLLRGLVTRFWREPYRKPLARWGTALHDRFLLPHYVREDMLEVIAELREAGVPMQWEWFEPQYEFRFPLIGSVQYDAVEIELRHALEPWHVLGEEPGSGGTARFVDSSVERIQVRALGPIGDRYVILCNGRQVPLSKTATRDEHVAGIRFRAWQPPHCLHPRIAPHTPLVFDVVDTWNERSIGGCTYHVGHPGGRSYDTPPVNAYEADSRRRARFEQWGHTPGRIDLPPLERNADMPLTLDLRRPVMRS